MSRSGRGDASFPAIIDLYPRCVFNSFYSTVAVEVTLKEDCEYRADMRYCWPLGHTLCYEDITAHSMLDQAPAAMQEVNAYHACDADLTRVLGHCQEEF